MKATVLPVFALLGLAAAMPKGGKDDSSSSSKTSSSSSSSSSTTSITTTTSTSAVTTTTSTPSSTFSISSSSSSSSSATTATTTSTPIASAAECYYTPIASSTAYAASQPNPNLSESVLRSLYTNSVSSCSPGSKFTAYELGGSDHPWFGGIVYSAPGSCSVSGFQGIVGSAMKYNNPGGNPNVVCDLYRGQEDTRLQKEAKKYFKDAAKNK